MSKYPEEYEYTIRVCRLDEFDMSEKIEEMMRNDWKIHTLSPYSDTDRTVSKVLIVFKKKE